jgi:hypothetical protein
VNGARGSPLAVSDFGSEMGADRGSAVPQVRQKRVQRFWAGHAARPGVDSGSQSGPHHSASMAGDYGRNPVAVSETLQ